jgi:hypothetical protein
MRLVGDYRYAGCELAGAHYAIIWNGPTIERVREVTPTGNPVIWQAGDPMTDHVLAIIAGGA